MQFNFEVFGSTVKAEMKNIFERMYFTFRVIQSKPCNLENQNFHGQVCFKTTAQGEIKKFESSVMDDKFFTITKTVRKAFVKWCFDTSTLLNTPENILKAKIEAKKIAIEKNQKKIQELSYELEKDMAELDKLWEI